MLRSLQKLRIFVDVETLHKSYMKPKNDDLGVSKNRGTPKSSILIGFSIINHPFWGTIIFGNIHFQVRIVHVVFSRVLFHLVFSR